MSSKGEELIRNILEKEGYHYIQEYTFKELSSFKNRPLRYDFAVFSEHKILCLIEYQGSQHYTYCPFYFKNKLRYNYQRAMDIEKKRFALMHNIPLYCIPYTEYNNLHNFNDICNEKFLVKNKRD